MIQKKTAWQTKFIEPCMFVCVGNFNQQIRPPTGKKYERAILNGLTNWWMIMNENKKISMEMVKIVCNQKMQIHS